MEAEKISISQNFYNESLKSSSNNVLNFHQIYKINLNFQATTFTLVMK